MIFTFLYPFSLIPLRISYLISDYFYYLLYYIIRYRRKVVSENIKKAFSYLSEKEQIVIEKQFYKNFCDNFIETIKLLSLSQKELQSHITADYSELEKIISEKRNCHIYLGHQFNWEWANTHIASVLKNTNIIVAYKPIRNHSINNLMLKIRSRFGSKMVASKNIKKEMEEFSNKQHILILVADQNPKIPERSFWTSFLSQKTAFLSGTELYTASNKTTSFFANIIKVKRGHYKFIITPLFDFSKPYKIGIITHLFTEKLENAILANPENYLWSHKRWKLTYKSEYKKRWISDLQYH
ncbi:lysophospholipid acyltransferase family protein [Flavobacterium sp. ZE23DGlu08]|uniref:lysophospholipid acyltransferase family protein n=1 Tax=Flavobacterium sp. ZE23DGlu08 TaxID=3059026 RepID=UPI00266046AC|nr:lysophospholipid acyltransferase family protein [Flavobacterium sp. ZE23DGlu08]WKL43088.1 lysophospholipid acyltransferase family protein [Flavobacterium sp. ZE23DGlu08]